MMNYQKLVDIAKEDWKSNPNLAEACEKIICAVSEKPSSAFRHMTFSTIKGLIDSDINTQDVVRVTQYLCGERIQLLEAGFEYITNEESFILDDDNSHYALTENAIAHPDSGDVIHNVKKNIFMYFYPSERLRDGY
ncbi:hypothetical protein M2G94_04520 [Vibrio vulnificus]|nr:hypothetical protein [Vibrio vulnificus]